MVTVTLLSGDVRQQLVLATIGLLAEDGPWAIRARTVAKAVGASTSVVYGAFGGMPALVQAVAEEGFARLDAALAAPGQTKDPVRDAARMALAYRDFARGGPHLFDLMFGLSTPGGHGAARRPPTGGDGAPAFTASFGRLVHVAQRMIEAGRVQPADPQLVAGQLWSFSHGFITLELTGHFDALPDAVQGVMLPLGANVVIGLGDKPKKAYASGLAAAADWAGDAG